MFFICSISILEAKLKISSSNHNEGLMIFGLFVGVVATVAIDRTETNP